MNPHLIQPTPRVTRTKEEFLDKQMSVLCSVGISTKYEELDIPSHYWTPNLHRCPFKQCYISGYISWGKLYFDPNLLYLANKICLN
jgi:hypothetical protein